MILQLGQTEQEIQQTAEKGKTIIVLPETPITIDVKKLIPFALVGGLLLYVVFA